MFCVTRGYITEYINTGGVCPREGLQVRQGLGVFLFLSSRNLVQFKSGEPTKLWHLLMSGFGNFSVEKVSWGFSKIERVCDKVRDYVAT